MSSLPITFPPSEPGNESRTLVSHTCLAQCDGKLCQLCLLFFFFKVTSRLWSQVPPQLRGNLCWCSTTIQCTDRVEKYGVCESCLHAVEFKLNGS